MTEFSSLVSLKLLQGHTVVILCPIGVLICELVHYSGPFCSLNSVSAFRLNKCTLNSQIMPFINRKTKCGILDTSCTQCHNFSFIVRGRDYQIQMLS